MFKLESYVTPILLDYLSKYVKNIRPEDLQVSIWEGEVHLHNLDLRLDVLQEELKLPLEFISGHIHDLSIRVPWTKITSEPITITINTIEFVLKLKNPQEEGAGSSASSSPQRSTEVKKTRKLSSKGDERPPSPEIQNSWLISKIINNISLECHNIILKYVEEDIVVSMNIQLLSFTSGNEKWENAMIDVHPVKVLMRKIVKVSDLTICLDNRNAAGQIEVCQEPLLYRSSLECRVFLKYNANNPESNRITRIGVFTNLLDMNISSMQIPLCIRLIKMVEALNKEKLKPKTTQVAAPNEAVEEREPEEDTTTDEVSLLKWFWSILPSIVFVPEYEDEQTNEVPCHTIDFGFYAKQLSFTLKHAELVTDMQMAATKRIRYSPVVRLNIGGIYFEFVSAEARNWMSAKAGVTSILIEPLGAFKSDNGNLLQSEESSNQRPFIDKSLFDDQCLIADKGWGVTNYEEYSARITEDYLVYRSPVLAIDFIKFKVAESTSSDNTPAGSGSRRTENSNSSNRIQSRFLTAGLTFRYTHTLEQVKQLISEFINSYDYPAYYTEKLDRGSFQAVASGPKLPPPLMEDYDALMQHIPLCTYKFSVQRLTIEIYAKTEAESAIQKLRPHSQLQSQFLPLRTSSTGLRTSLPPHCVIYVSSAGGSMNTPLQPDKLVHTTCQLPEKPSILLDACYENYTFQIKELSCSLVNPWEKRSSRFIHIPNFASTYRKLLQPQNWKDETLKLRKLTTHCELISLNFTRRELNSFFLLMQCAYNYNMSMLQRLVRLEAADMASDDLSTLRNNLTDIRFSWDISAKQNIWCMTMYGWESTILCKQQGKQFEQNIFSTTTLRGLSENHRWLECNVIPSTENNEKERISKTVIAVWLAPFSLKLDANVLKFLRCEKFKEMETGTSADSVMYTQILGVPSFPSNASVQSSVLMSTPLTAQTSVPLPPSVVRRSSRSSLQRRISHPEETIHVSSERDEKLEKETSTSMSARIQEENNNPIPNWLLYMQTYILYIEIECGTIYVGQNLERDDVSTKFFLPRIHLKPSSLEPSKVLNTAQLQSMAISSKDNNNVNWTLALSDFGIESEFGASKEALLQSFQTTITLALLHKNEKIKKAATYTKEETDSSAPVQVDKITLQKESVTDRSKVVSQTNRPISPTITDYLSSPSATIGGRSDKDLPDNVLSDTNMQTGWDLPKAFGKASPKRNQQNRDTYTFNLHADTSPIRFLISSQEIRTLESHLDILIQVIRNCSLSQQSNRCIENPVEGISILTATEENPVLKEFMDLETNSDISKNSDENNGAPIVILLFCQWTITRITLETKANSLDYQNSKVIVDLEDLLSTVDKREDYTKCTSKVGNFNVTYFEENLNGEWVSQDGLSIRLLGETTSLPFVNVIFTAVGLKNFFKRIGAKRKGDLNRNLNELLIKMQAVEIIVNLERLSKFVAAVSGFFEKCNEKNNINGKQKDRRKINAAHDMPMIHLDSKGFALYLPLDKRKDACSAGIFRVQKISVSPILENPLQRKPLRADIFGKAAQLGMLGTPGSMIEDRQYELTLENISASSGSWHQISKHMSEQRDNFHRTNPAFEWNNQNRKPDLQITDIFNKFTFVAIYAPAIVYQNVLICGEAIEFNCATDYEASLNMYQINMLSCLVVHLQNICSFLKGVRKKVKHASVLSRANRVGATSSNILRNNASITAFVTTKSSVVPLQRSSSNALTNLRDMRNSSTFNSIDEGTENNLPTSDSGFQSCVSHIISSEPLKKCGSISTLSSLPQVQHRNIPQTISLVAGVFVIKFYDTFDNLDSKSQDDNSHLTRRLFSITVSQPSFMYIQNVFDSKAQVSIYDFFIHLASTSNSVGDLQFNESIVATCPGEANAAGITPPLLTFRMHCTKMQLRECDIEIAKPIALQLTELKARVLCRHLLLLNATLLQDPCFEVRSTRNIVRGSKIRLMRQQCANADRLHIYCRKIILRFQSESKSYNCKLVSSDLNFNMKFLNRPEKATAKVSVGAFYLLADQKVVLHPVNLRLSADFISEPWHELPLVTAIMKINLLEMDLGINSVLHLQEALEGYHRMMQDLQVQWQDFLRNRPFEENDSAINNKNLELLKCPPICTLSPKSSKSSLQREEFYQDDLRAGAFQFVEMNTDTFLPMPYQIQIIKKNFGIICWRYPQPRKMSRIHVYPVPMAMPNPIHIRCRMEYYSEVHETFLHYCDFYLSETVSKQIQLPERRICANIWRVVIVQSLISVNGACFNEKLLDNENESQKSMNNINIDDVFNTERKESDFILHPKVLVGCMRIDTNFESKCVPKMQFLLSCNFLTIKFLNQPNHADKLPSVLEKYKLVQTTNVSQTFLIINFQNISVHTAVVSSGNFSIESSVACSIKCLDYGFLNMLPVLEKATIQSCIRVDTEISTSERDVSVNLVLDRMRFSIGPTIMHSLLTSKAHWERYLEGENARVALVPRCVIVNRTYTFLTFGQSGTSERIPLHVREACMYSFRSDYHSQELTFFITDAETEMKEASQPVPISLKYSGEVMVQPVRVGKKCIFIKCCKLSPMQIYVLITGQIELISMIPHEMRLDFRRESSSGTKKSIEYLVDKKGSACFYYSVDQKSNISMRLKLVDSTAPKPRSGDIPLRSNKNLPWLVKVPHAKFGFISFWVRVFREDIKKLCSDNFKPQKILITIWPIFEICSMMPFSIKAEEEITSTALELLPGGECQALNVPATHLTDHLVKFNFNHKISEQSMDQYVLTLKRLEWKEFFYYDEDAWNVENVLTELNKSNVTKWPCDEEEEIRVQRIPAEPKNPAILYNCMPSRNLSCTLRLEVSPWGYLINSTSMVVSLVQKETNESVSVNSNELQMLFAIKTYFSIAVSYAKNWIASSPIYFEDTVKAAPTGNQYYVLSQKTPADIVILRDSQILKFMLSLKIENNRRILTLRPKFAVTNFSKTPLWVVPFAMDHKETAKFEHVEILDSKIQREEVQPVESRDDCVGIALDSFHDLFSQKAKRTVDTAFVCFICIKVSTESDISIPIPLSLPFTRRCFSAQIGNDSIAFAVTLIEQNGIHYLNIFNDPAPALLINNQTDMKFIVAQTNASENSKVNSTTPEYMGRHFEWYQVLKSYSSCYYTPPEMYANFPDVESAICNLTLALYKKNFSKKDIKWSKPIRTDKSWEKFLHIPNHGDVKIIICDKHRVIRVLIFYILQQKEFSVKDLRSRLSTTLPTSIDSDESCGSITTQPNSPINKQNVVQSCMHHQVKEDKLKLKTRFRLHTFAKEIVLTLHTESKDREFLRTEVLSVYVDDFLLVFDDNSVVDPDTRSLNIILQNLQIDNQLHSNGKFDFPVIICAQDLYERTSTLPQTHYLDSSYKNLCSRAPMIVVKLKFYDDELSISEVNCSMSPLRAYIEDAYLNELFDALVECVPSNCVFSSKETTKRMELTAGKLLLPREIAAQAICFAEPLQLRSFRIEPLDVLLSVHTSVRLYIALDHSPLSFSTYQRQQVLTMPLRFGQSLGMHYLSGAIFGAGWVVGSLEILGSPSGLARSFSTGLRDFVAMPVQGLLRGPWGFIVGVTQGSASLLRNVTAGTVNSVTKLAASVARNLDRLTLDREHIERTEALRRVRPNSLSEGFSQGLTGLGISILGAVGGIAHHTLEARSPVEVVTGVGKGIVGALTKPISGAAELVALTGQGVLQTVGFNALPTQRVLRESNSLIKEPSAYRIWKLIPSDLSGQVLFYHEITLVAQNQMRCAHVFLTSTVFAILIAQWDKLELAYPVNKVSITRDRDDKTLFYLRLVREGSDELEDNISYTNERIISFLRSSHSMKESRFSMGSLHELLLQGTNSEEQNLTRRNLDWAFYINDFLGEHLMQYLKILRNEI